MSPTQTTGPPERRHFADGELGFEADALVDEPAAQRVFEALGHLNAQHDWWAQPLEVTSPEGGGPLRGRANLTLVGYEAPDGELVEVDPDDDAFMAWMDLCVAVDFLRGQSHHSGVGWRVHYGAELIGTIVGGEESDELEAFLVAMGETVGADFDERDDERAIALDEVHSDRL